MSQALTEAKLREWMQKMGPRLITLSAGICHDRHRAEEIAQEAFIKLWQKPPDAGEIAYTSWLRRVVVNLSINALQRTKRPGALPDVTTDPSMQTGRRPDETVSSDEAIERMKEEAAALGANAVLNVRFATSTITQGAAELLAYGTAVIVEEQPGE